MSAGKFHTPSSDKKISLKFLPKKLYSSLMAFQKTGIRYAIERKGSNTELQKFKLPSLFFRCLFGDEMGLGKTLQAIGAAYYYKSKWPLLIVCPSSMKFSWVNEIEKWIPDIQPGDVNIVSSFACLSSVFTSKITIISYGLFSFNQESVKSLTSVILKTNFGVVILDESHYIKNSKSTRTKQINKAIKMIQHVFMLSGTPSLARPDELYPQVSILKPGLFGDFQNFANKYCDGHFESQRSRGGNIFNTYVTSGASNLEDLNSILKRHVMIRRLKQHVLKELPAKRRQKIIFKIAEHSCYKKQVDECYNSLKGIINKLSDVDQIDEDNSVSRFDYNVSFSNLHHTTALAKAGAVKQYICDMLQGMDNKFLVFCFHLSMVQAVRQTLIEKHVAHICITGESSSLQRGVDAERFQTDAKCKVAVLSIQAASAGLTLTAADHVVFAELHYTPGVLLQAEDRCHRIGQVNAVQIHYLIAMGTIDEVLWSRLQKKVIVTSNALNGETINQLEASESHEHNDFLSNVADWIPFQFDQQNVSMTALFQKEVDISQKNITDYFNSNKSKSKKRKHCINKTVCNDENTAAPRELSIVVLSDDDDFTAPKKMKVSKTTNKLSTNTSRLSEIAPSSLSEIKLSSLSEIIPPVTKISEETASCKNKDTLSPVCTVSSPLCATTISRTFSTVCSTSPFCTSLLRVKKRSKNNLVHQLGDGTDKLRSEPYNEKMSSVIDQYQRNTGDKSNELYDAKNNECTTHELAVLTPPCDQPVSMVQTNTVQRQSSPSLKGDVPSCNETSLCSVAPSSGVATCSWQCLVCTFSNHALLNVCEMCETVKTVDVTKYDVTKDDVTKDDVIERDQTIINNDVPHNNNVANIGVNKNTASKGTKRLANESGQKGRNFEQSASVVTSISESDDELNSPPDIMLFSSSDDEDGSNESSLVANKHCVEDPGSSSVGLLCDNSTDDYLFDNSDVFDEIETTPTNNVDISFRSESDITSSGLSDSLFSSLLQTTEAENNDSMFDDTDVDELMMNLDEKQMLSQLSDVSSSEEENEDEVVTIWRFSYRPSYYTHRIFLYNQQDSSYLHLHFNLQNILINYFEELPLQLRHPDHLKQIKSFTYLWQQLGPSKQNLLKRSKEDFVNPVVKYRDMYKETYGRKKNTTNRFVTKVAANKEIQNLADNIGGNVVNIKKKAATTKQNKATAVKQSSSISTSVTQASDGKESTNHGHSVIQAIDRNGNPLCLRCSTQILGVSAGTLEARFCSDECTKEYKVRRRYTHCGARELLFDLEQGVCQLCGYDTHALYERIRNVPANNRKQLLQGTPFTKLSIKVLNAMVKAPKEGQFWQADHINPVAEGGGECGLENYRTLCAPCHRDVTRQLMSRLSRERKKQEKNRSIVDFLKNETLPGPSETKEKT